MAVNVAIPVDKSGNLVVVTNPAIHPLIPGAGTPVKVVKSVLGVVLAANGQIDGLPVVFNNPA